MTSIGNQTQNDAPVATQPIPNPILKVPIEEAVTIQQKLFSGKQKLSEQNSALDK